MMDAALCYLCLTNSKESIIKKGVQDDTKRIKEKKRRKSRKSRVKKKKNKKRDKNKRKVNM